MHITRRGFMYSVAGLVALEASRGWALADDAGATPATQPQPKNTMFAGPIESVRLEDDLYVLLGAGGNVTVSFNNDRLLVIDSGVPNRGAELLAAALKLSPNASKKTLFNTHYHFDHTGGNGAFAGAGFNIVGSASCRERMGQTITFEDIGMVIQPSPEPALPTLTFDQGMSLFEASTFRVTKIAAAHTDTDAIAFVEKYNTLVTGDLHFSGAFPVIDRATGGSLDGMIAATKLLLTLGDARTRVLPGHGPVGDKTAVQAQLDLLNTTHDRLAPFGERKATMEEVMAAKPLADLDDQWGRGFLRSPVYTKMAYGQWLTK